MKITYNLNTDKAFKRLNLEPDGLAMQTLIQTCLRYVEPYTPLKTGTLIRSVIYTSDGYKGTIEWNTPYAQYLYYGSGTDVYSTTPHQNSVGEITLSCNGVEQKFNICVAEKVSYGTTIYYYYCNYING